MATVTLHHPHGSQAADTALVPRDDWAVLERADHNHVTSSSGLPSDDSVEPVARYVAAEGPFRHWSRRVVLGPDGVQETIEFQLATPMWGWFLTPIFRRALRRTTAGSVPWWTPPGRFDQRGAETIALLTVAALLAAFLGTQLSQTISFAADEFGKDRFVQGQVTAMTRGGALLALGAVALADRVGRKRMLIGTGAASTVFAVATAAAPTIWVYGTVQLLSRGFATAFAILIAIYAAEEAPASSRAWVTSALALVAGLGSGMVIWLVPVADAGVQTWRILCALAIFGLPAIAFLNRRLHETRRFDRLTTSKSAPAPITAIMRRRFAMLAVVGFAAASFNAPASNFLNEFLRDERGFEGIDITLFVLIVSTPIGIGVAIAGPLADRRGRRLIGAIGLAGGVIFTVVRYSVAGPVMWIGAGLATIIGAATIPALGVYGPELFPTSRRGLANGLLTCVNVVGSVLGLLFVGWAADAWGFGRSFQVLAIAPLLAILVIARFPRTARKALEELNPGEPDLRIGDDPAR